MPFCHFGFRIVVVLFLANRLEIKNCKISLLLRHGTKSQLRQLVTIFLPRKSCFSSRVVHLGFVVDTVGFLALITSQMPYTDLSTVRETDNGPKQSPKFRRSFAPIREQKNTSPCLARCLSVHPFICLHVWTR